MAGGWLARLGLRTREQRAWATYDWANSAFQCTIITAVFPIYFASVAVEGLPDALATARFATATTLALTIIAILSPMLGAYADYAGAKKRLLGVFLAIGVVATAATAAGRRTRRPCPGSTRGCRARSAQRSPPARARSCSPPAPSTTAWPPPASPTVDGSRTRGSAARTRGCRSVELVADARRAARPGLGRARRSRRCAHRPRRWPATSRTSVRRSAARRRRARR